MLGVRRLLYEEAKVSKVEAKAAHCCKELRCSRPEVRCYCSHAVHCEVL